MNERVISKNSKRDTFHRGRGQARPSAAKSRRESALQDEHLRFERLISDLSARFVNIAPDQVDREIERALDRVLKSMPLLNGIDAVRQLRKTNKDIKVVFLTMNPDVIYAASALEAGALGYVLKRAAVNDLVPAIETVMRGELYISPSLVQTAE